MQTKSFLRKGLAVGIILLFVGTGIIPSMAQDIEKSLLSTSRGNWLYVGGSGPGNYTRIQDAIDNASDGDTVFVYDESSPYYEDVNVNKRVTLVGEDKETTVIDGGGKDVIVVYAQYVTITGFTLQNSTDGNGGGIRVIYSDAIIKGNIIKDNYRGINLFLSGFHNISENIITNNKGVGISVVRSSYNFISKNYVTKNNCGIELGFSNYNKITQNVIVDNGGGLQLYESGWNSISKNIFRNNSESAFVSLDFRYHSIFINIWLLNYWSRPRLLPKPILTRVTTKNDFTFPWLTFDWCPAKKPYDIPGMR